MTTPILPTDVLERIAALERMVRDLERKQVPAHGHALADTGWVLPPLLNGWLAYGTPWDVPLGYRRVNGIIYMTGLIKSGALTTDAFVLPVGFRPSGNMILATASNDLFGELRIFPTGGVQPSAPSTVAWVSLVCSFPAA